jgi:hypothetical protein
LSLIVGVGLYFQQVGVSFPQTAAEWGTAIVAALIFAWGRQSKDANVTNNHPIITGKIVLAHLKESLDYYKLLDVAELEGDLAKAVAAGNLLKIKKYYKKLAAAKIVLAKAEARQVK